MVDTSKHIKLAHKIAHELSNKWGSMRIPYDDIFQSVFVFMERCARYYDPERINPESGEPYKWSTYFYAAVRRQQSEIICDAMGVRHSSNIAKRVSHAQDCLSIEKWMSDAKNTMSNPYMEDDANQVCQDIYKMVKTWGSRYQDIFFSRLIRGETQSQVGNRIGISAGQVSRIEKEIIERITKNAGPQTPYLFDFVNEHTKPAK